MEKDKVNDTLGHRGYYPKGYGVLLKGKGTFTASALLFDSKNIKLPIESLKVVAYGSLVKDLKLNDFVDIKAIGAIWTCNRLNETDPHSISSTIKYIQEKHKIATDDDKVKILNTQHDIIDYVYTEDHNIIAAYRPNE